MAAVCAKKISRAGILYEDGCIIAARCYVVSICGPSDAPDEARVPAVGGYIVGGKGMPDVHNAVSTARCKLFSVGRPGYRKEEIRMALIDTAARAAGSIPDVNSFIARAGGDMATIG